MHDRGGLSWRGWALALVGIAAFVVIITGGTMTAQTRRDIEFGLAVLIVAPFVVSGFVSMCWWLICLIGRTQP